MATCDTCGQEVNRYKLLAGRAYCLSCRGSEGWKVGFKWKGKSLPLAEDHMRNLGGGELPPGYTGREIRRMAVVAKAGGSVRYQPNLAGMLRRAVGRVRERGEE